GAGCLASVWKQRARARSSRSSANGTCWTGVTAITSMREDVAEGRDVMGDPQSAQPAAGNHPAGREARLILLAGSPSTAERALVTRWLRDGGIQPAAVLPLNGPGLARSLDQAVPQTGGTALRVAWLPRERGGERRA